MLFATTLIPLFTSLACLFVAAYVHGQRRQTPVNRAFVAYALSIALATLFEFLIKLAPSPAHARVFVTVSGTLVAVSAWFFYDFAYLFMARRRDAFIAALGAVIAATIVLHLSVWPTGFEATGLSFPAYRVSEAPLVLAVMALFCLFGNPWCAALAVRAALRTADRERRLQLLLLAAVMLSPMLPSLALLVIVPLLCAGRVTEYSSLAALSAMLAAYYGVSRHDFLTVNISRIQEVSRLLFAGLSDAIVVLDDAGRPIEHNAAARRLLDLDKGFRAEPSLGGRMQGYDPAREYAGEEMTLAAEGGQRLLVVSQSLLDAAARPARRLLMLRDVTEQRNAEREVLRMRQIESLGVLAAGIAHDFNNLLTGVSGTLGLIRQEAGERPAVQELLRIAECSVGQATTLTRQLLTFAKGPAATRENVDLMTAVRETLSLTLAGRTVKWAVNASCPAALVHGDRGQICQVVQNLAVNAADAMPAGGTLTVTIAAEARAGGNDRFVRLDFSDTGVGIQPELQARVFEPYFTTKGQGSGLGLTICESIVRKHGGTLTLRSQPGSGTTVTVLLPAADAAARPPQTAGVTPALAHWPGHAVVVDDEPTVRMVLQRALGSMGLVAHVACRGEDALPLIDKAAAEGEPARVVITDLTIPGGMGGRELLQALRPKHPRLPVILMTGYAERGEIGNPAGFGFTAALGKPFTIDELRQALTAALGPPA